VEKSLGTYTNTVTIAITDTPQALSDVDVEGLYDVTVSVPLTGNAATVYIGDVTSQPIDLGAGDSYTLPHGDIDNWYIKGTAGDIVNIIGGRK